MRNFALDFRIFQNVRRRKEDVRSWGEWWEADLCRKGIIIIVTILIIVIIIIIIIIVIIVIIIVIIIIIIIVIIIMIGAKQTTAGKVPGNLVLKRMKNTNDNQLAMPSKGRGGE